MSWSRTRLIWMRTLTLAVTLCAPACSAAPQDAAETSVLPFNVARVRLVSGADTTYLRVQLATSAEQRNLGLMERQHLADTAGMLFLYPTEQPATAGFWMFRTRIPLDIAFLDSLGAIGAITHMVPCTATLAAGCPSYPPSVPYRGALEVNAGYFARRKLTIGTRLILSDTSRFVSPQARP